MDLTPEERAIGKENFLAAMASPLLGRDFLETGIRKGIASGAGLGPYYFGYDESLDEPVRVGVIGTGDEGNVLLGAINPKFIEVKSIADIRPYSIYRAFHGDCTGSEAAQKARRGLLAVYGWKSEDEARKHVKVYNAYQELITNAKADGVEAVIIALPLHLHAPAAIAAMKAGLHVITEKLMGHSVHECKEMARVARQTSLHLAVGHQRHYNILYQNSVKAIAQGLLGKLHYIRAQWHRNNLPGGDSWQPPMPKSVKPDDHLAEVLARELASWERALQAAKDPGEIETWTRKIAQKKAQIADEILKDKARQFGYEDRQIKDSSGKVIYDRPAIEELIRWRLWDRTGGGLMAELGSHQLDAASIFIAAVHGGKKQHPLSVSAATHRALFPPDRDIDDHVYCMFEFPAPDYNEKTKLGRSKKITVAYASINGNGFGGYGETVFGTEGTLILDLEKEALLYQTSETSAKIRVTGTKDQPKLAIDEVGDPQSAAFGQQAFGGEISRGYTEELEHWAFAIRKNPKNKDPDIHPRCYPEMAMADAIIALTTNLAASTTGRIDFKPEWFDPDSDETPEGVKPDLSRYA